MLWRNLVYLLGNERSYKEFTVPQAIMDAPDQLKVEFLRGIGDAGGFIRDSNNYMGLKRRVYIEVNNKNWLLPIQLCKIFQQDLDIPVHLIQWGHPNTRTPGVHSGKSWAKEHQVKIFAEHFIRVGFYVDYKQKILEEFVNADSKIDQRLPPLCNPNPKIRRLQKKPKHPDESSNYLPREMRGKHFNAYWELCVNLGCQQCVETAQQDLFDVDSQSET